MIELIIKILDLTNKYSLLSNILSSIIAALLFFFFKEKLFSPPKLNGKFYLKLKIRETERNPFRDMELQFIIHLSSDNNKIIGGGEKVYEDAPNATNGPQIIHYQGNAKTPISIEGSITKYIFSPDEINLLCIVHAKSRQSTMTINLNYPFLICKNETQPINGTFTWSASDKSGEAFLSIKKFPQKDHYIPIKINEEDSIN